jgi:hypothetical protein
MAGEAVISAGAQGVGSVIERDRTLINGEWQPAAGADVLEVINPIIGTPARGHRKASKP